MIGDSVALTFTFLVLVFFAILTQHTVTHAIPYLVRGPVKAAPALFLAVVSWYFNGPPLLTFAFLACAAGDVLLDISKAKGSWAVFEAGAAVFAVALVCLSFVYLSKPLEGRPLLLLSLPNIVLSLFVCLWVLP